MADIKFDIVEGLGVISQGSRGWTKELNLISWNGGAPKYDIRDWAPEHEKVGKGVTLTKEEAQELYKLLSQILENTRCCQRSCGWRYNCSSPLPCCQDMTSSNEKTG